MARTASASSLSLYTGSGRRKYLTAHERQRFLAALASCPPEFETLCLMLALTGCRITEALNLTFADLDIDGGMVSVHSLKKRKTGVVREVPVPTDFLQGIRRVHGVGMPNDRLWPISRSTAWRHVKRIMVIAEVGETAASPKGLRHGFGVHAIHSGIPLNLLQRWFGHSNIATTAIYADVMGPEEREIASRMWSRAI